MGQSNMAGRGCTCERWPQVSPKLVANACFEYRAISNPNRLFLLEEPFGIAENNPNGICDTFPDGSEAKTGSLVTAFCNGYYDITRTPLVGVSASKGGSSIAQWQPDAECGFLKDAVSRFEAAKKYLQENAYTVNRCFAVWCQGETDGDIGTSKHEYVMKFNSMWEELHKYIPDLFLIKTGQCNMEGEYDRYDVIRSAQDIIISEHKNVHLCSDSFYPMREQGIMKDAFHYYQHGYNICGTDAGKNTAYYFTREKKSVTLDFCEYSCLNAEERKKYIQEVVNRCALQGGQRVNIPEGIWMSGPIHLQSNIELHLCDNAVISFSDIPEDYLPVVFTRWEGMECYNYSPLIYARDCENVSITGNGKLLGNGEKWWNWKKLQQEAANELCYAQSKGVSVEKRIYGTREAALRPSWIESGFVYKCVD